MPGAVSRSDTVGHAVRVIRSANYDPALIDTLTDQVLDEARRVIRDLRHLQELRAAIRRQVAPPDGGGSGFPPSAGPTP